MTSEDNRPGMPANKRKLWIIVAASLVAIAVVGGVGVATGWGSAPVTPTDGAKPSSTATSPATQSPTPEESASESGDPEVDEADPAAPRATSPAIPLDQAAEPAAGVRVALASITAIEGEASGPGEVKGPALEITVNVENASANEALTDTLIVNVYYGPERTPANILVRPRQDLPSSIASGESAKGVYAFSVPEDARGQIVVEVDLAVELPVVLFEGAVS